MRSVACVVTGGIFQRFAVGGRAHVGTTTVFGALVAAALIVSHGQTACAQNKAAQTAAGAMIIQNNQMRQELRETRKELREIKEGLGIEHSAREDVSANPAVLVLSVAVLCAVAAFFIWVVLESASCSRHVRDGKFQRFRRAHGFRWLLSILSLAVLLFSIPPQILDESTMRNVGGLILIGWLWCVAGLVFFARHMLQESRVKRLFDEATQRLSGDRLETTICPSYWFVRFPDGSIMGPLEKEDVQVTAGQGRYPPGTHWSNSESGPWEVLVKAREVAYESDMFWVRTPQGMSGGPYTKAQLSKAIASGRIPDGSQAALSPDGPWRRIVGTRS